MGHYAAFQGTDWVAFGGVAQLIAAIATVTLAGITAWMAFETRKVARETKDESAATVSLASEARTDRELTWRPQLSLLSTIFNPNGDQYTFDVFNAGAGPAIGCKVLLRRSEQINEWSFWSAGDIAPNSRREGTVDVQTTKSPYHAFIVPAESTNTPEPTVVIFCSDVIGRRFRFPMVATGDPDDQVHAFPAEIVSPKDSDQPSWTTHPMLWSDEFRSDSSV